MVSESWGQVPGLKVRAEMRSTPSLNSYHLDNEKTLISNISNIQYYLIILKRSPPSFD